MVASELNRNVPKDEIDVIAAIRLLWRYKYVVGIVAILCGLVAVYLALTATPIYRAEVVINDARTTDMGGSRLLSGSLGGLASLAGLGGLSGSGGPSQEAQAFLSSYRLAAEFIKRHDLVDDLTAGGQERSLWFAVKRFREIVLKLDKDKTTGITTAAIEWTDPAIASRWANDYVALANELIRARTLTESSRNIAYLNDQIGRTNVLELQHVMYDLIESETKTLMLAKGRVEYAFTIVDPAVAPEKRIRPKRTLIVLGGLVAGMFLGSVLVFGYDLWRRYREQIRDS